MYVCELDGEKIKNQEILHTTLAASLGFPPWYGRNLDALFDCLTDVREETEIRILQEDALQENLGKYAGALKAVLDAAAKENSQIRVFSC